MLGGGGRMVCPGMRCNQGGYSHLLNPDWLVKSGYNLGAPNGLSPDSQIYNHGD